MSSSSELSNSDVIVQRRYRRYTLQDRLALIELVENKRLPVAQAGKMLDMCPTSARLIIKTYRVEKRIFQKRADKEKRLQMQKELRRRRKAELRRLRREQAERSAARVQESQNDQQIVERGIQNLAINDCNDYTHSFFWQYQIPVAYSAVWNYPAPVWTYYEPVLPAELPLPILKQEEDSSHSDLVKEK